MSSVLNISPHIEEPTTGITDVPAVIKGLERSLADTYVLMAKSQACHWNVTGPIFHSIHELTEEHYNNLFEAVDEIAERMRSLGHTAPVGLGNFLRDTNLAEWTSPLKTDLMVASLIDDHETTAKNLRDVIQASEDANDHVTADLLTERIAFHEQASWMLKAIISK